MSLRQPFELFSQVLVRSQVARPGMTLKVLGASSTATEQTQLTTLLGRSNVLVSTSLEVFPHPKSSGESCCALGGQDVVGTDTLLFCEYMYTIACGR